MLVSRSSLPAPIRFAARLCLWPIRRIRRAFQATEDIPLRVIARYLPADPIILEAGAADGKSTLQMAAQWPSATIYAFEPVALAYEKLVAAAQGIEKIHTFQLALSDQPGEAQMYVSSG